jgi:DNA-binding NtrC family response regulator
MKTHLLVVDDDNDVREGLAMHLSDLGYAVRQARSGDEGLEYFHNRGPFGCVISDYQMPGLKIRDGVAMLAAIRAEVPEQKCIIQSASWNLAELMEEMGIGDIPILHKPYSLKEMAEALTKMGVLADYGKADLDDIRYAQDCESTDGGVDGIIQGWKK